MHHKLTQFYWTHGLMVNHDYGGHAERQEELDVLEDDATYHGTP